MEAKFKRIEKVYQLLKYTYGFVPIVAGADKFANLLTNWKEYMSSSLTELLPFNVVTFMAIVGIIEITAGVLVLVRPKIGAWVVMGWLLIIALSLVLGGHYFDVAVRDIVMAVGAFALAKLSGVFNNQKSVNE
ncbi:MAG: hypothetical protein E6H09_09245 [Bacteroidetes bacterium]|jgi:uncharacterized membrane protein YphA (DoxX/SURF4 family)|nr:MAG: hypothetical protein E6H09_09245 [Bacteroidota bacterium]